MTPNEDLQQFVNGPKSSRDILHKTYDICKVTSNVLHVKRE